jgi:hypothetical protein
MKIVSAVFVVSALMVSSFASNATAKLKLSPCEVTFSKLLHDGTKYKAVATSLGIPLKRGRYEGFSCGFSGGDNLDVVIKEAVQGCLNESKRYNDQRSCAIVYAK